MVAFRASSPGSGQSLEFGSAGSRADPDATPPVNRSGRQKGSFDVGLRPEFFGGARLRCRPCRRDRSGPARPYDPRLQLHGGQRRAHRRGRLLCRPVSTNRPGPGADAPCGQAIFQPLLVFFVPLGIAVFMGFRIHTCSPRPRERCSSSMPPGRPDAGADLPGLHPRLDYARVLHHGGRVRLAVALRLHDPAQSRCHGLVHVHGRGRHLLRDRRQLVPASSALHFAISIIGVVIFAGLTAWDTQKIKEHVRSDG